MAKAQKTKNLKLGVLGLLGAWSLGFGVSDAEERGIGVSPARIEIGENAEWPHTVPITVTNFSAESERFEILFEKETNIVVSADPARFLLESGARGRVLVTFENPKHQTEGLVKAVSFKTSPEGFTTGTGVKIPFYIVAQGDNAKFFAGVNEAFRGFGGFSQLFGAAMILATILLLWYLSGIAKTWIFNSNER